MFASKTPRDLNHDPQPWLIHGTHYAGERSDTQRMKQWLHAPRPEFDHVQHNEPNPVLILFRMQRTPLIPIRAHIDGMLSGMDRLLFEEVEGQMVWVSHVQHARKVLLRLRRLAALS